MSKKKLYATAYGSKRLNEIITELEKRKIKYYIEISDYEAVLCNDNKQYNIYLLEA